MTIGTDVVASLGGIGLTAIYRGKAPADAVEPFATFIRKPHVNEYSLDKVRQITPVEVAIYIWDAISNFDNTEQIAADAYAQLESYTSASVRGVFLQGQSDVRDKSGWGLLGTEIRAIFHTIDP